MAERVPGRRLALVDGHSLLHRAYFALPALTNSEGQPTQAVYGFLTMLFRLLEDERPSHLAVALDRPGPTFRDAIYQDYKAHRPSMADDLRSQEPLLERSLELLRVPVLSMPGYEADDIIGTASRKAAGLGFDVLIVTGDRDAYQLVDDRVHVLMTKKGISEMERLDLAAVRERYGVEPPQLVDVKGLAGDTSDNIPGIPGIGEKTALGLIRQFGSLEEALARAGEAGGKRLPALLVAYADQARLSKRLARIDREAPIDPDWEDCRLDLPPEEDVRPFFLAMEFKNLLRRYPMVRSRTAGGRADEAAAPVGTAPTDGAAAAVPPPSGGAAETPAFQRAEGDGDWRRALAGLATEHSAGTLAVAFEAVPGAITPTRPERLAVAGGAGIVAGPTPSWDTLGPLAGADVAKAGHGVKRLGAAAAYAGQPWDGWAFDTELAAYLLDPGRGSYPLDDLCRRFLDADLAAAGKDDPAELKERALAAQAAAVARLVAPMEAELAAMDLLPLFRDLEMPLVPVLARLEAHGVCVDRHALAELGREFTARLQELEREIHELAGGPFNINSTQQLREVLFDRLGLQPLRKTKTGFSTDADTLEALGDQHPLPAKILEFRGLAKLQGTYVVGLAERIDPRTGRIHTTMAQTVAATGRLSSIDPNLQNIPVRDEVGRRLRRAFVAPPGHVLVAVDYSQIELRLLAHFSRDERLVEAFRSGADIHRQTAAEVMGVAPEDVTPAMRNAAKAVNFGIVYGISDFGLSRNLGVSQEEAHDFIRRYFERYPGVRRYLDDAVREARERGFVRTLFGRIRHLPEIQSRNYARRQYAERTAMNTPLQGTAADLIKIAMLRADRALRESGLAARMVLQVHDELIFEAPEGEARAVADLAVQAMSGAADLLVPLVAEAKSGRDWYAMTPIA